MFWQRAMQAVYNKSMQQLMVEQKNAWITIWDERSLVTLKKNWMPTMTWKDDALILHAVSERELLYLHQTKAFPWIWVWRKSFGSSNQKKAWWDMCWGPICSSPFLCDL